MLILLFPPSPIFFLLFLIRLIFPSLSTYGDKIKQIIIPIFWHGNLLILWRSFFLSCQNMAHIRVRIKPKHMSDKLFKIRQKWQQTTESILLMQQLLINSFPSPDQISLTNILHFVPQQWFRLFTNFNCSSKVNIYFLFFHSQIINKTSFFDCSDEKISNPSSSSYSLDPFNYII